MKITIFKPDGIGDFVLALGCIREIINQVGAGNVEIIVSNVVAPLAVWQFPGCEITPLTNNLSGKLLDNWWNILPNLKSLWHHPKDQLICLRHQRSRYEQLMLVGCRAKKIFLCSNNLRNREGVHLKKNYFLIEDWMLKTKEVFVSAYPSSNDFSTVRCIELKAHANLLKNWAKDANVDFKDSLPSLTGIDAKELSGFYISPYSSSDDRDYPERKLLEVIELFEKKNQVGIVLCGSPQQNEKLQNLNQTLRKAGVLNVKVFTPENLVSFVEHLSRARLVLSMDTATAHLATAMNKKTVILYGKSSGPHCIPWSLSNRQKWLCQFDGIGDCVKKQDVSAIPQSKIIGVLNDIFEQNN